jgi:transposase
VALTVEQRSELSTVVGNRSVDAVVAGRARMVLWRDEGYSVEQVAVLAGVSRPTVNTWVRRHAEAGLAELYDQPRPGKPAQVPGAVRARILALTQTSPPAQTGLTHWSSRALSAHLARYEGMTVSHNLIADLWRRRGLQHEPLDADPPEASHPDPQTSCHRLKASPTSTGNGSRSIRLPLPRTVTSPPRQSMSPLSMATTSAPRSPNRDSDTRIA